MTPREKVCRCISVSGQIQSLTMAADCVQTGDALADPDVCLSIVIDILDVIELLAGLIQADSGDAELALLQQELGSELGVSKPS